MSIINGQLTSLTTI